MSVTENEFTLKDVILGVKDYFFFFLKRFWFIALFGLAFAGYKAYKALNTDTLYSADLTFILNEKESQSMGGVGALLGQFGFNAGSGGEYNISKIIELGKSRKIVQKVIFSEVELEGKVDYLGNHLIDIYELNEKWRDSKDSLLLDFRFSQDTSSAFTLAEGNCLRYLHSFLTGNREKKTEGLTKFQYDKDSGLLTIRVNSINERFSYIIADRTYLFLSDFYIDQAVKKQVATYDIIKAKVDSVEQALSSAEYQLSLQVDALSGIVGSRNNLQKNKLLRKVQMLSVLYAEGVKNQETAAFILQNTTPMFQVVDEPLMPLRKTEPSLVRAIIIGGIIGGIVAMVLLIVVRVVTNALNE